jgi:hypothetical protein
MLNVPATRCDLQLQGKPGAQVIVNGKPEAISDPARRADHLLGVEKRMSASAMPGATADSWRVMPPVSK